MNAKEILAKSKAATANLISNNANGHQSSIYNEDIFKGLTDKEKSHSRTQLRKWVSKLLNGILDAEGDNLTTLCQEFMDLYTKCYKVQDFTLASIASGNTNEDTKDAYTKALAKVKTFTEGNKGKTKKNTNKGTK